MLVNERSKESPSANCLLFRDLGVFPSFGDVIGTARDREDICDGRDGAPASTPAIW
jgi:hypothetical protein